MGYTFTVEYHQLHTIKSLVLISISTSGVSRAESRTGSKKGFIEMVPQRGAKNSTF